jgi:hypothetical protein
MEDTPLNRLLTTIEEKLNKQPDVLSAVKEIALNIKTTGMSISDSALLSRLTDEEIDELELSVPEVSTLFRLRRLEHKQSLLKTLYTQATVNNDIKITQYLLEKNFSEEFDPSVKRELAKKKPIETDDNILDQLKDLVRSSAPPSPVSHTSNLTAEELLMTREDVIVDNSLEGIINHG